MKSVKFQFLVVLLIALCVLIAIEAQTTTPTTPTTVEVPDEGFLYSTCTEPNTFAITFDDGPRDFTMTLLDDLKNKGVKATFFMNGHGFEDHCIYNYSSVVKRAFDEGHQIAIHTWSHLDLQTLPETEFNYQFDTLDAAFAKMIGVTPTYMRPPFGSQNETVQQMLKNKGYKLILWDMDTMDFQENLKNSFDIYASSIAKSPEPTPHILLNHDRVNTTSMILAPFIVTDLLNRGYKLTTVAECIGDSNRENWYKVVGAPQEPDASWFCTLEDMHLPPKNPPVDPVSAQPPQTPAVPPA